MLMEATELQDVENRLWAAVAIDRMPDVMCVDILLLRVIGKPGRLKSGSPRPNGLAASNGCPSKSRWYATLVRKTKEVAPVLFSAFSYCSRRRIAGSSQSGCPFLSKAGGVFTSIKISRSSVAGFASAALRCGIMRARGLASGPPSVSVLSNGSQGVFSKPSQYTKLSGLCGGGCSPDRTSLQPRFPDNREINRERLSRKRKSRGISM
jgi:hypothetical protein